MEDNYYYLYNWKNNDKRKELYKNRCKVITRGKRNSILIEMEFTKELIVTSRYAIRKLKPYVR